MDVFQLSHLKYNAMNRNKLLLFFVIFIFATIISSCQKKQDSPVNSPGIDKARSQKVNHLIKEFKADLLQKTSGTMQLDSSVWYIEGLLNYEQANNLHNFSNLNFFKDSITLTPENGLLSLEQINSAYDQFTATLQAMLAQQNDTSYHIDLADISFSPTGFKDGSVELVMGAAGGTDGIPNFTPFGLTDYWYWGGDFGKCDNYQGQGVGLDAADQLQYRFNHPLYAGPPGYVTDVDLFVVIGPDFPGDPSNPGPYCDYIIFYTPYNPPGFQPCLSPDELNFYLSKFDYIKEAMKPAGKTFRNIEVYPDVVMGLQYSKIHSYYLHYGFLIDPIE